MPWGGWGGGGGGTGYTRCDWPPGLDLSSKMGDLFPAALVQTGHILTTNGWIAKRYCTVTPDFFSSRATIKLHTYPVNPPDVYWVERHIISSSRSPVERSWWSWWTTGSMNCENQILLSHLKGTSYSCHIKHRVKFVNWHSDTRMNVSVCCAFTLNTRGGLFRRRGRHRSTIRALGR